MKLATVFHGEVVLLRLVGQCALTRSKGSEFFIYNQYLYIIQLIAIVVYTVIKIRNQTNALTVNDTVDHYLSKETTNIDVAITLVLIMTSKIYENLLWTVISVIRFVQRKKFAGIYNNLLLIDQDLKLINPETNYVQKILINATIRVPLLFIANSFDIVEEFRLRSTIFDMVSFFLLGFGWRMIYNQQLMSYDVLRIQTQMWVDALHGIKTMENMERAHRSFVRIIHTKRLIDKAYNYQFVVDIFGNIAIFVLVLYTVTKKIQSEEGVEEKFMVGRSIIIMCSWLYHCFYVVSESRKALERLVLKFQDCSDKFKPKINFYSLLKLTATNQQVFRSNTVISSVGLSTLFKIFGSICSWVVIIHQFRQIAILRKNINESNI